MTRQASCGRPDAVERFRTARKYLELAQALATEPPGEDESASRKVAAGNAVLAAIAASDALCCLKLGTRSRDGDHRAAALLLRSVNPDGANLAKDLRKALSVKDLSHYSTEAPSREALVSVLRAVRNLVRAADVALRS